MLEPTRLKFKEIPINTEVVEILDDSEEDHQNVQMQLQLTKQQIISEAILTKNMDEMKKAIFMCCLKNSSGIKKDLLNSINLKYIQYFKQKLSIDISKEYYKARYQIQQKTGEPDTHHIIVHGVDFITPNVLQSKFKGLYPIEVKCINASNVSIKFSPEENVQNLLTFQRKMILNSKNTQIIDQGQQMDPYRWIPLKKYCALGFQRPLFYRLASKNETSFNEDNFDQKRFQKAKNEIQRSPLFLANEQDHQLYNKYLQQFYDQTTSRFRRPYNRSSLPGSEFGQLNGRDRTRDMRSHRGNQYPQNGSQIDPLSHRYDRRHNNFDKNSKFHPYENDRHNKGEDGRSERGNTNRNSSNYERNQQRGNHTERQMDRRDFNDKPRQNYNNRNDNNEKRNNNDNGDYNGKRNDFQRNNQSNNRDGNSDRQNRFIRNEQKPNDKKMEVENDYSISNSIKSLPKSRSNSSKSIDNNIPIEDIFNKKDANQSQSFAIQFSPIHIPNQNNEASISFNQTINQNSLFENKIGDDDSIDLDVLLKNMDKKDEKKEKKNSSCNSSIDNSVNGNKEIKPSRKNSSQSINKSVANSSNQPKTRGNRLNSQQRNSVKGGQQNRNQRGYNRNQRGQNRNQGNSNRGGRGDRNYSNNNQDNYRNQNNYQNQNDYGRNNSRNFDSNRGRNNNDNNYNNRDNNNGRSNFIKLRTNRYSDDQNDEKNQNQQYGNGHRNYDNNNRNDNRNGGYQNNNYRRNNDRQPYGDERNNERNNDRNNDRQPYGGNNNRQSYGDNNDRQSGGNNDKFNRNSDVQNKNRSQSSRNNSDISNKHQNNHQNQSEDIDY